MFNNLDQAVLLINVIPATRVNLDYLHCKTVRTGQNRTRQYFCMHYYILVINMNMYTSTNEKLGDVILKCRDTNRMQHSDIWYPTYSTLIVWLRLLSTLATAAVLVLVLMHQLDQERLQQILLDCLAAINTLLLAADIKSQTFNFQIFSWWLIREALL